MTIIVRLPFLIYIYICGYSVFQIQVSRLKIINAVKYESERVLTAYILACAWNNFTSAAVAAAATDTAAAIALKASKRTLLLHVRGRNIKKEEEEEVENTWKLDKIANYNFFFSHASRIGSCIFEFEFVCVSVCSPENKFRTY